jgi:S-adenosylmethionine-diacylgycerolhomoserine-N-methlytransferase
MNPLADARILYAMARGLSRGTTHPERLQNFYAPQAEAYDAFRERLLHGREQLIDLLPVPFGGRVVELGAGTGRNLEFFGSRLVHFDQVEIVDLCPALLEIARRRTAKLVNVRVVEADATQYRPAKAVDAVYFSYALTMIPDWRAAIDNALAMLAPGGVLGVVDFHLPRLQDGEGRGSWRARSNRFWRRWFAHNGVYLSEEHLPYLRTRLNASACLERAGRLPYLPWLKVPHYVFVGRRAARPKEGRR